jgi:hypothetical protein
LDDLSAAYGRAVASIETMIGMPNMEDWRGWKMLVLDAADELLFEISFSSVIGRLH